MTQETSPAQPPVRSAAERVAEQTLLRTRLLAGGFVPLANRNKMCVLPGWPTMAVDEAVIKGWADQLRYVATGVRVDGPLVVLDFDIDDGDMLDAIWAALPDDLAGLLDAAPLRFGGGEKFALFMRLAADEAGVGYLVSQGYAPPGSDKLMRVEVFGSGGRGRQVGAYGVHSHDEDGGVAREYSWAGGVGLADVGMAGLPEITVDQIKTVLDVASGAMREGGWEYEVSTRVGEVDDRPRFDIEDGAVFQTLDHGEVEGVAALEALCSVDGAGLRLSASWLEGDRAVNRSRCIARLNAGDDRLQIWESAGCVLHRPVGLDVRSKIARLGERLGALLGEAAVSEGGDGGGDGMSRLDALLAAVPEERRFFGSSPVAEGGGGDYVAGDIGVGFDLAHDALALGLGRVAFDDNARFVPQWGKWLLWDGLRWCMDDRRQHMTLTREYLRGRAEEVQAWAEAAADAEGDEKAADKLRAWAKKEGRALRSASTIAAVAQLAQSNEASVAAADDFDTALMLVGTPDGVVDLGTGEMREARREDMITRMTGWAPRAGVPTRWLKFLDEVFEGDQEVISFMQRAAGYALTGRVDEHKMLFLYGGGRNGKGVFLNVLTALWGDYVEKAAAESFLTSTTAQHPTNIAKMKGARLVVGAELPKGKVWDEGVIKDLTGGDTMTARFMRQDYFDFVPQLTLMIAGNNQPSFRGVDEAIRARVVMVPFTVTIPAERRDTGLKDRLLAEEGGQIMQWVIEGALAWQQRGLDVPEVIREASQAYFDGEDIVGQFMGDTMTADPNGFETTTDLYDRFRSWCDGHGLAPWTMHTFRKEMVGRGLTPHRNMHGKGFKGYWLKARRRQAELADTKQSDSIPQ